MSDFDVSSSRSNAAFAAAVSAHENGARRVLVLEKAPKAQRGGNTHFSGAIFPPRVRPARRHPPAGDHVDKPIRIHRRCPTYPKDVVELVEHVGKIAPEKCVLPPALRFRRFFQYQHAPSAVFVRRDGSCEAALPPPTTMTSKSLIAETSSVGSKLMTHAICMLWYYNCIRPALYRQTRT